MPNRKAACLIGTILILAIVGVVVALIRPDGANLPPPTIKFVKVEPAEMFDTQGQTWSVTLSISNSCISPGRNGMLYMEDVPSPIQARVADEWVGVEGSLACDLISGTERKTMLLVPASARSCQFSFRYCDSRLSFSHQPIRSGLEWLAERLPLSVRLRFPSAFWRWVGFGPRTLPSNRWRRVSVEVPLPNSPVPSAQTSGRAL